MVHMGEYKLFKEGDGIVYHYTSLDTFMKILDGVENEKFIFHATDIFSKNDPTEFYHGFKQLWDLLPKIENDYYSYIKSDPRAFKIEHKFLCGKYKLSNIWDNLGDANEEWPKAYIDEKQRSYRSPFVISFSCHEDYLPMWSTYGDKGMGIALGIDVQEYYKKVIQDDGSVLFDFSKIGQNELRSVLVSYDDITMEHFLAKYVRIQIGNYLRMISSIEINDNDLIYYQLKCLDDITNIASSLIKNKAYEYEEESRLVANKEDIKDVQYKISPTKKILPYINIGIPTSKLKKLVIGPCCDYNNVKNASKIRLEQLEIHLADGDFVKSKVPFRSI